MTGPKFRLPSLVDPHMLTGNFLVKEASRKMTLTEDCGIQALQEESTSVSLLYKQFSAFVCGNPPWEKMTPAAKAYQQAQGITKETW